jgi:transposase
VRATTLLNRLLNLDGVRVVDVDLDGLDRGGPVVVQVASRRRRLACPQCDFTTRIAYDRRGVDSRWRHLDLGGHRLYVRMRRRRLACPSHGVLT